MKRREEVDKYRDMPDEDLQAEAARLKESLFRLNFKLALGEIDAVKKMRQEKKALARLERSLPNSYLKGQADLQGFSYGVVRFDSAATAFAQAQKVQSEMLDSASENNWPVQSLVNPVPGAGQMLGGYGTKDEDGLTATLAVVGTNVGPYLVAVIGASTESPDNAKNFALTVFKAVAAAVA